jgi:transglutaminase-like putative cysteine protease
MSTLLGRAVILPILLLFCLQGARANEPRAQQEPPMRSERHHEVHKLMADGRHVMEYSGTTRVTSQVAVERARQLTLSYSRSAQAMQVQEAYTLKANGRRLPVPRSSWQLRTESGREGAPPIFSDYNSITLVFPELAVGDAVVVRYRLETKVPLFPGKVSFQGDFPRYFAYDDVRVTIEAPASMPLKFGARGLAEKISVQGGRRSVSWTWRNPIATVNERADWSVFDPESEPGYSVSSFDGWSDIAASYVRRAEPKAAPTPRLRQLAAEIVQGRSSPREQAQALYEWVATKIDYAGNCVGIGAVVPRDLNVVLDHRLGDCKDKATLLQALLAVQDIPSHQVLVNASNQYRLPSVPVAAAVNYVPSLSMFLDSTDGLTSFGRLPVSVQDKPVLAAIAVPVRTPADPGGNTQTMHSVLRIQADGSLQGEVAVRLTGLYAQVARQRLKGLGRDERSNFVKSIFRSSGLEGEGSFEADDATTLKNEFAYSSRFTVRQAMRLTGSGSMPMVPWFYSEAPVTRFAQHAQAALDGHDVVCLSGASTETYEIHLPAGLQILSVPEGTAFAGPLLSYESSYEMRDQVLRARRDLVDKTPGNVCSAPTQQQYKSAAEPVLADIRKQLLFKQ